MATSTQLVSGLASGLDWRSVVDQLIEVERVPVNLLEKKQVGVTTNMLDIVTAMQLADKVISM